MGDFAGKINLADPVFAADTRRTHFFNGRLLTAADLKTDQDWAALRDGLLGQGLGEGVVQGLEVGIAPGDGTQSPQLAISRGLGFNRKGQPLWLAQDMRLTLVPSESEESEDAGLFTPCAPAASDPNYGGAGFYILVACPASGLEGSAPMSGIGGNGKITGCGSRYENEGVRFRTEKLRLDNIASAQPELAAELNTLIGTTDFASMSLLRNLLAHFCLGTFDRPRFAIDPFGAARPSPDGYGAVDLLRGLGRLGDCDLPLAMFHWTDAGVRFVDQWAVRRILVPLPPSETWALPLPPRSAAEAEAAFRQFQEHLEALANPLIPQSQLTALVGNQHFRFLPAAGFLPLGTGSPLRGFDLDAFFQGQSVRSPVHMNGARLQAAHRGALEYAPIDLRAKESIWLYYVRENAQAAATELQPPTFVLFATAHAPFLGEARFDLNYYGFANYSSFYIA